MGIISAQVSLYPLRQTDIGTGIREAVRALRDRGLTVRYGAMSTLVWGEDHQVFAALEDAFQEAAKKGDVVMTATFSNACPLPENT